MDSWPQWPLSDSAEFRIQRPETRERETREQERTTSGRRPAVESSGLLVREVLGCGLVNADAAGLNYPETPRERSVSERTQHGTNQ